MRRAFANLIFLSFAIGLFALRLNAAAPPVPSEIDHWISELNAPEFAHRERATSRLIEAGPVAASALIAAAKEASPEASVRIAAILRTWYTSGQDELIDAAEVAFEQLSESKNRHLASRAAGTLRQYAATIGQPRALAQIEKLGGKRILAETAGRFRGAIGNEPESLVLMLGTNWKGGADSVKYLRRVPTLQALFLAGNRSTGQIKTPGITLQDIDDLKKTHPWLQHDFRGPAFLGVTANAHLLGCQLAVVALKSPAARATLNSGDVLTQFDGKPVNRFEELVDLIATKQPGDVVKAEVLRGDLTELENLVSRNNDADAETIKKLKDRLTVKVEVTLGEWGAAR